VDRIRVWGPRAVAAVGFAAYALVAPPGLAWLESGELVAAGVRLGSGPSTGFPLFCMLAKLASLVPVGELAFRVHLLSAGCAALAMLWTARLVDGCAGEKAGPTGLVGGIAAAVLLGVTLTFARHGTVAGVQAPTVALLAATALLFDRVARGGDARFGLLLAVVVGLGLGLHVWYRVVVPVPVLALLWVRLRRGARWPLVAPLVALSIGVGLHLYLPVRSATGAIAAVDRGHPREARALAEHAAGTIGAEAMSLAPGVVEDHAGRFLAAVADEIGLLGLIAALAGAASLLLERRSRWLLVLLGAAAVGDAVLSVWVWPERMGQGGVSIAFVLAGLAGLGAAWLGRFAGPRAGPAAAAAAGAMLVVGPALVAWPELGAGEGARAHGEAALAATPSRGLLLSSGEPLAGLVLFLTAAEGARPDVAALDRSRLDDRERSFVLAGAAIEPRVLFERGVGSSFEAGSLGGRPVAWELGDDVAPVVEMRGPVGVVAESPRAGDIARSAAGLAWLADGDATAGPAAAKGLTRLGRLARGRGELALALQIFDAAVAMRPGYAAGWVELGAVLARLGRVEEAAASVERGLALEPNRVAALLDAARYRLALGDAEGALRHAERAVRLEPGAPAAWTLAALADVRAGRTARARERLTRALTLDPDREDARAALRGLRR
jgi:Flp pilus assembly protein TadD